MQKSLIKKILILLAIANSCVSFAKVLDQSLGSYNNDAFKGLRVPVVVSGDAVAEKDLLNQVVIKLDVTDGICTGVAIAKNRILTAAHCVDDLVLRPENAQANFAGFVYRPIRIDLHPGFKRVGGSVGNSHDLAILTFEHDFFNSEMIVNLDTTSVAFNTVTDVMVAGYGDVDPNSSKDTSGELHTSQLITQPLLDQGTDEVRLVLYGDRQSCFGDSGGPVFIKSEEKNIQRLQLVGLISTSRQFANDKCVSGARAMFIKSNINWIRSILNAAKVIST